jgi:hypothetical protein
MSITIVHGKVLAKKYKQLQDIIQFLV